MPIGVGEILMIAVLAFIFFGPRKPAVEKSARSLGGILGRGAAVLLPALVIMDRAGSELGLPTTMRLWLALAAAASSLLTLSLVTAIDSRKDRR